MGIFKWFRDENSAPGPESSSLPEAEKDAGIEMENHGGVERSFAPGEIEQAVTEVLRTIYDPEISVNIYEMGLVYDVDVDTKGKVIIQMTLTSPGCPVAGSLIPEIEAKTRLIPGVTSSKVILVWDPPWAPEMMSDAAKLQLGIY
jgi:FeS assembly SUF system protein